MSEIGNIMNIGEMSTHAIVEMLGERIKNARLNKNLSQEDLEASTGLSRKKIMSAEKGRATLETLTIILMAIGQESAIDAFLPDLPPSPMQMIKLRGKQRKRASRRGDKNEGEDEDGVDW